MNILITGGIGRVGTAISKRLIKNGYGVRVLSLEENSSLDVDYVQCDIMNIADLSKHMTGFDAIIHLAAIPSPVSTTGEKVFETNVAGTFNVYEAAAKLGIKRIVQASSINALGCFWGNMEHEPQYLPMDEKHPLHTTDPYSFSKEMVENIAAYYWRRTGITSLSYRLPAVWNKAHPESEHYQKSREQSYAALDDFASQSSATQQERLNALREACAKYRANYGFEYPNFKHFKDEDYSTDPLWSDYLTGRLNYWAFITEDDSALAFEKGVTATFTGSHPLFINYYKNWLNYDSQRLVKLFFPTLKSQHKPLKNSDTLVSLDKARALIGFKPEFEF